MDWIFKTGWLPSEGDYSLDMNSSQPGAISQTFDTVSGVGYTVLFDMAGNTKPVQPGDTTDNIVNLEVTAVGKTEAYSFDMSNQTNNNMGWVTKTFSFTANSISTTLTFKSTTTDDSFNGPTLDNVRVNLATSLNLLFQDSFNTTFSGVNDELATRQTGSTLAIPISYVDKGIGTGELGIFDDALGLEGSTTRSVVPNHNFVDNQIIAAGGLSVCLNTSPKQFGSTDHFALRFRITMGYPLGDSLSGAGSGFPDGAVTFNLRANGADQIL